MSSFRLPGVDVREVAAYEILSPHGERAFVGSCTRAVYAWLSWSILRVDILIERVGQWNGYPQARIRASLVELHTLGFIALFQVNGYDVVTTSGSPDANLRSLDR